MYRNVFTKWLFALGVIGLFLAYGIACEGKPEPSEPTIADASAKKETKPEAPAVREVAPDGLVQPQGVGEKCRVVQEGQGTCKSKATLCGPIGTSGGICFENCADTNKCALASEQCVLVREMTRLPVCVTVAKKGEVCGLEKRIICPGEVADPPLFCVEGKCKERPKAGWDIGEVCSPPRGDVQSDCKSGLACIKHSANIFQCVKPCTIDKDCPSGETCWDEPLNAKVCVTAVKAGGKCDKLKRLFCKTENALNPLTCEGGVCKSNSNLKQLGEKCTKSVVPGKERGDCDQGMLCLGVSRLSAICHKSCKSKSDCPSSENCASHPNLGPGDPIQACVIPISSGGSCDLAERKMCKQEATKFFQCKKPDETTSKGVCTEVKIGDGCKTDGDCGRMLCIAIDEKNPAKKYCLVPCDPKAPKCPSNGGCQAWAKDGPTTCVPAGPKQQDDPCTALQAVGDKLNTATLCTGGFSCVTFKKGNPAGICMKPTAQCAAGSCSGGHVCLPAKPPLCALDCSKNPKACKPGTKCSAIKMGTTNYNICGPTL